MKTIRILMFASVAFLALSNSCKKDDNPDMSKYTIYTTGQYYGVGGAFSCYWKNSEVVNVPDLAHDILSRKIFVSNGDVYLAGARDLSTPGTYKYAPSYWKNGVRTDLDMGDYTGGTAYYLKVANGKVYTAGYVQIEGAWYDNVRKYCYWINKERIEITDLPDGATSAAVTGLFVVGNDVYVSGVYNLRDASFNDISQACYWKNGVRTDMPESNSSAGSIFVDNGKVYIAGNYPMNLFSYDDNTGGYWVDGQWVEMGTGEYVTDIFVEKGIVYLNGSKSFWKGNSKTKGGGSTGMYVKDGIVFTSGFHVVQVGMEYAYYPHYWVNDKRFDLPFPVKDKDYKWTNMAFDIFVE